MDELNLTEEYSHHRIVLILEFEELGTVNGR